MKKQMARLARMFQQPARVLASALLAAGCAGLAAAQEAPLRPLKAAVEGARRGEARAGATLAALGARYAQIGDFIAYWRAGQLAGAGRHEEAAAVLEPVFHTPYASPVAGRAAVLGARAWLNAGEAAKALAMLARAPEEQLPEPPALLIAAQAEERSGRQRRAVELYQQVYYRYPLSAEARDAAAALGRLGGAGLPAAGGELILERAAKLSAGGRYEEARQELLSLAASSPGAAGEVARVRAGVVLYAARKTREALEALSAFRCAGADAEAERLFGVLQCQRRLEDTGAMMETLAAIQRTAPASPWTLQALVAAANYFLVRNDAAAYVGLYRACADRFPQSVEAAGCHWKVAWRAYLEGRGAARNLFQEHLRRFPASEKAGAALYYLGRIEEESGRPAEAETYYSELQLRFPNYYYSFLSSQRPTGASQSGNGGAPAAARAFLGSVRWPVRPRTADFTPDAETAWRIGRARLLARAGLETWAEIELRFGVDHGGSRYAAAMELAAIAAQRGAHGAALRHLKGTAPDYLWLPREGAPRRFWELAYPFPYRAEIEKYSRLRRLDPYLVAALIRQESEFDAEAVSSSGAVGLMQVMPATGRQIGRKAGLRGVTARSLKRPAVNLAIGTYFLARQLAAHQGGVEETLASYNAGPTRVPLWRKWADFREAAEFTETIPFAQTRDYVQIILRNWQIYRWLYGGQETGRPAREARAAPVAQKKGRSARARQK